MKLDVYVSALIDMNHMIIDVPDCPTNEDIVSAVLQQIKNGNFHSDGIPELRYVENNNTECVYFDA